ncbi:hypothetical protein GQ457_10G015870 [Hibiscus cannabinus]
MRGGLMVHHDSLSLMSNKIAIQGWLNVEMVQALIGAHKEAISAAAIKERTKENRKWRQQEQLRTSPHDFVKAYAAHLKRSGKIELPSWTDIVKTGKFKELPPYDPDWYFIRAASMARKIYLRGGLGVGAFRRIYGGAKQNGSCPHHFCKSSGSVARHILQQLQNVNIIDIDPKG